MKKYSIKPRANQKSPLIIGATEEEDSPWIYLGRLAETGSKIDIHFQVDSPHVIAIVGKRGSGKSYTMGSILESLCTDDPKTSISLNPGNNAILLFDTLGIFQWSDILLSEAKDSDIILNQKESLKGWPVTDEKLNIQTWIPEGLDSGLPSHANSFSIRTSDLDASDWGYLLGLDIYQDRMGQLLNDLIIKVTIEGWGSTTEKYNPTQNYKFSDLIECIKSDTELLSSYHDETRRAVLQQLKTYQRNQLFDDNGTKLEELLTAGTLSILVMNKMSEDLRLVVASALIRRILADRTSASEIEKTLLIRQDIDEQEAEQMLSKSIPPCWIAIDEAQNILPSERRNPAGEMLVRFVREGRNYGLSFMVATQQPTAIDSRIMAQVDALFAHKLAVQKDIEYIKQNMKSSSPDEIRHSGREYSIDDTLRALEIGQAILSSVDSPRYYLINIRPRISVHGGF